MRPGDDDTKDERLAARGALTFGEGLEILKGGGRVRRVAWRGARRFLQVHRAEGGDRCLRMVLRENEPMPGNGLRYIPDHSELLADDWEPVCDWCGTQAYAGVRSEYAAELYDDINPAHYVCRDPRCRAELERVQDQERADV